MADTQNGSAAEASTNGAHGTTDSTKGANNANVKPSEPVAKNEPVRADDIPRSKPIPIPPRKEERRWAVPNHTPPK